MLVLGIDPGIATMGYGLVDSQDEETRAVCYGTFTTPPDVPLPERLRHLYSELEALIERHCPTEVAIEDLFVGTNLRTALAMGQARGIALLAAANHRLSVSEYTPSRVKQTVAGYGRGSKQQIQEMVRLQLGLAHVPQPDDAADALAVALCHILESRTRAIISAAAQEVRE